MWKFCYKTDKDDTFVFCNPDIHSVWMSMLTNQTIVNSNKLHLFIVNNIQNMKYIDKIWYMEL